MEIRFGRPIVSADGERVGAVEGFLLDTDCRIVREIRILHGNDERSIPHRAVTSVDDDGIIDVNLTAFEVQQSSMNRVAPDAVTDRAFVPYTSWVTGETTVPTYIPAAPTEPSYRPSERDEQVAEGIEIDGEIVVAGPGGKVVGSIAGLVTDETGRIEELIIGTGFLRPDIRVNMETVEYVEGSYVSHML